MRIAAVGLIFGCCFVGWIPSVSGGENVPAESRPQGGQRQLVARVFGNPIYLDEITPAPPSEKGDSRKTESPRSLLSQRGDLLFAKIRNKVLAEYPVRAKLRPTNEEINALIGEAVRKHSVGLTDEAKRKLALQGFWTAGASCDWRTAKAICGKYGGRVAISSFGACEPFEGRNALLREYAASGEIEFRDAELERAFWEKSKDERIQDVMLPLERVAQHFSVPPWERWTHELESPPAAQEPGGASPAPPAQPREREPARKL